MPPKKAQPSPAAKKVPVAAFLNNGTGVLDTKKRPKTEGKVDKVTKDAETRPKTEPSSISNKLSKPNTAVLVKKEAVKLIVKASTPANEKAISTPPLNKTVSAPPTNKAVSKPPLKKNVSTPPITKNVSTPPANKNVSTPPVPIVKKVAARGKVAKDREDALLKIAAQESKRKTPEPTNQDDLKKKMAGADVPMQLWIRG
jgi:hypothetical protein